MAVDGEENDTESRHLGSSSTCDTIIMTTKQEISGSQNNATGSTKKHIQQNQQRLTLKILARCLKKQNSKSTTSTSRIPLELNNISPLLTSNTTKAFPKRCRYQNGVLRTNIIDSQPILQLSKSIPKKVVLGHCCKIIKRKRRSRMRSVKKQEYNKLREMVPALQEKNKVSKVVVIEEAIKYIDELHSALIQRFRARSVPTTFNGVYLDPQEVDGRNIRDVVRRLLANANPGSLPPARIENVRTTPSFLQKYPKHKKT